MNHSATRQMPPPSGDKIAAEIEREMEDRLYPLRNVTLAPAEYHVYLHPDDFAYLEGIIPRIVEDVQACLNLLVQRLNRRSIWSRLADGKRPPIEVPPGGWAIHVKVSTNDEVKPGEIGIHSRLSVPASARFGSGAGTVRITETVVGGADRRSRTRTESIPAEPQRTTTSVPAVGFTASPPPAAAASAAVGREIGYQDPTGGYGGAREVAGPPATFAPGASVAKKAESPGVTGLPKGGPHDLSGGHHGSEDFAPPPLPRPVVLSGPRLRYRDDSGEHVHPITKDLTKIGRGGAEHWVDVMVTASAQVSREHCRIRRDAVGRLFLQDVSTWGTYVDGVAVEKYVDGDSAAREHELSHGVTIRLADAVTLELLLR